MKKITTLLILFTVLFIGVAEAQYEEFEEYEEEFIGTDATIYIPRFMSNMEEIYPITQVQNDKIVDGYVDTIFRNDKTNEVIKYRFNIVTDNINKTWFPEVKVRLVYDYDPQLKEPYMVLHNRLTGPTGSRSIIKNQILGRGVFK